MINLQETLADVHTIAIIGIAKNAGKTTVLNKIIQTYKTKPICITSIGLDGEEIDNITGQEKPRITVYPGMYVLTAKACLLNTSAEYIIHEELSIHTALGEVTLVEITKQGQILVAGPATKQQMISAIGMIKKYNPYKILIDGAIYRKSISSKQVSEGIIFVTGASYSSDINEVVKATKSIIDQYRKNNEKIPQELYEKINENTIIYDENSGISKKIHERLLNEEHKLMEMVDKNTTHIYLSGALTDRIVNILIKHRHSINKLDIIVQDSSYVLLSPNQYRNLEKMGIQLQVLNPIKILFIAYNPTSPFNYSFDNIEFKALLREELGIEPINILQDLR